MNGWWIRYAGDRHYDRHLNTQVTAHQVNRVRALGLDTMEAVLRDVAATRVYVDARRAEERGKVKRAAARERWRSWDGVL